MKDKTIIIMGGGAAGWISALYLLNKSKTNNYNLNIKLISSDEIDIIGVGEGTTPIFVNFINSICNISTEEFLRETKGSFKFGIKFDNWNFNKNHYYHLFSNQAFCENSDRDVDYDFIQYAINNELSIPQDIVQKKINGISYDLIKNNKIHLGINDSYSCHFSAKLVINFLKNKCLSFENFQHIENTIQKIEYNQEGYIENLKLKSNQTLSGNFFINCLGFNSNKILRKEYFDIEEWDNYILNDSAFAIQVKNSPLEKLDLYTTATAQEYGWSWKIPQYEKTGYGYVYSSGFITNQDKLYNDLLKTYNIKENDVFKTKVVKSKPYYNKKQLYKNCLSLGLSSGFIEPLEATSIHMTISSLYTFFDMFINNTDCKINLTEKNIMIYNFKMESFWRNVLKFIVYHYFTRNPINDYWKHYKNIEKNKIFEFYEKYTDSDNIIFGKYSYLMVGLGLDVEDFYGYRSDYENYLNENFHTYLKLNYNYDCQKLMSHNEVLNEINRCKDTKIINYF